MTKYITKQDIINLGASLDIPTEDTLLILQKIMDVSSKELFLMSDIDDTHRASIELAFQQRQSGIPLEYILGETDFYGYTFFVNKHTLIPRNDTEVLVDKASEYIKSQGEKVSLVDVGTGSGCIGISIFKQARDNILYTVLLDISEDALQITKKNLAYHNLDTEISLKVSDLFSALQEKGFDSLVVTANLPYILDDDFENIDTQTASHEPHSALFGGEKTGFELYEKLVYELQRVNSNKTILFIEIGFDQGSIVRQFCKDSDIEFQIYKDNAGIERCVEMKIH